MLFSDLTPYYLQERKILALTSLLDAKPLVKQCNFMLDPKKQAMLSDGSSTQ